MDILKAYCNTVVYPLLTHWRYYNLVLISNWYTKYNNSVIHTMGPKWWVTCWNEIPTNIILVTISGFILSLTSCLAQSMDAELIYKDQKKLGFFDIYRHELLSYWGQTKWLTFCRGYFHINFLVWKLLYFDSNCIVDKLTSKSITALFTDTYRWVSARLQ